MARTSNGFEIAEADLRLRGPGDFLGDAQSGLPKLRFGDLARDLDLIEQARFLAASLA
jgi:ATP-dependent DNA helicase RecG